MQHANFVFCDNSSSLSGFRFLLKKIKKEKKNKKERTAPGRAGSSGQTPLSPVSTRTLLLPHTRTHAHTHTHTHTHRGKDRCDCRRGGGVGTAATLGTDHEGVAQHGDDGAFLQVRTGPVLYGLLGVHPLLALQRVVAEGHGGGAAPLADVLRHAAVRPQHARHAAHRSASHPTKPAFCSPLCKPPNKASILPTPSAVPTYGRSARHQTKPFPRF